MRVRRETAVLAGLMAAALLSAPAAAAPSHGLSIFGDLAYPPDFQHFNYVNPAAPKGGRASQIGPGGVTTFDSFNAFIVKGDAAQGLDLVFDTLMARAYDERDAVYGLVAEWADVADDRMSVTFKLRPEAKFADGTPVTAEDVVFSFETLRNDKSVFPRISVPLQDVEKAEALDGGLVRYTFKGTLVRDLPITVATLPILSKAFYATRAFDKTTLEAPLGSGPYKVGPYRQGSFVTYVRRPDYWAADLPVNRGLYNFAEVRYDYFRDRSIELENLLSGEIDFREEFTSKDWASGYDKEVVRQKRVRLETIPDERPSGAQGFFINTRRDKFKDVRVRQALDLAFDFEWSNRNLFSMFYKRTNSYFENSDLKAESPPSAAELALLEPYRDRLPKEVFAEPYASPVTDGSGNIRDNLKKAAELLTAAGWVVRQEVDEASCGTFCKVFSAVGLYSQPLVTVARNAKGELLEVEILVESPSFERIVAPYIRNLRAIGVDASQRRVEAAQYEQRTKDFDFDITTQRYSMRQTPGIELKAFWGSDAARTMGSDNLAGIADPVLDALIEKIVAARSREELVVAARAADRVLRAGHYWVPQWYKGLHNLAFWDRFAWPDVKPKYERGALETWWYDAEKDAKLKSRPPPAPAPAPQPN